MCGAVVEGGSAKREVKGLILGSSIFFDFLGFLRPLMEAFVLMCPSVNGLTEVCKSALAQTFGRRRTPPPLIVFYCLSVKISVVVRSPRGGVGGVLLSPTTRV